MKKYSVSESKTLTVLDDSVIIRHLTRRYETYLPVIRWISSLGCIQKRYKFEFPLSNYTYAQPSCNGITVSIYKRGRYDQIPFTNKEILLLPHIIEQIV